MNNTSSTVVVVTHEILSSETNTEKKIYSKGMHFQNSEFQMSQLFLNISTLKSGMWKHFLISIQMDGIWNIFFYRAEQKQAFEGLIQLWEKEYIEKGYASKLHASIFFIYKSDMVCHMFLF